MNPIQQARKTEKLVLDAIRVTKALGELKGAVMKVVQMLSIHEGPLPKEVIVVLGSLQKEAPKVSFDLMQRTLSAELQNFDPIWKEVRDHLLEALDYLREADNLCRMRDLHLSTPEILVAGVIPAASSRRVLTMAYMSGLSPDKACSDAHPQELRDRWGWNLPGPPCANSWKWVSMHVATTNL